MMYQLDKYDLFQLYGYLDMFHKDVERLEQIYKNLDYGKRD